MDKKVISVTLAAVLALSATPAFAEAGSAEVVFSEPLANGAVRLVADGRELPVQAVNNAGRTYVSLRELSQVVDAYVQWDVEKQQVSIEQKSDGEVISLTIGSKYYQQNGDLEELETPPYLEGETPMIPVRILAEALEGEVEWDGTSQTVTITSKEALAVKASSAEKTSSAKLTPPADVSKPLAEAAAEEETALPTLADWGYALKEGIYVEDMAEDKSYGFNFCILDLGAPAGQVRASLDKQAFTLVVTDKYLERVVYSQSFVYGELPKVLGDMVNLHVPLQYFNESQYSYEIIVKEAGE